MTTKPEAVWRGTMLVACGLPAAGPHLLVVLRAGELLGVRSGLPVGPLLALPSTPSCSIC